MNIELEFEGEEELKAKIEELSKKAPIKCKEALRKSAILVEKEAKQKCPVDTGRLRSSITHQVTEELGGNAHGAKVGTDVHYGIYVELGTSKMAAQPYLVPALKESMIKVIEFFNNKLKELK